GSPLGARSLILILRHRASCDLLLGWYPRIYWLRNSAPIFVAMSGNSFTFSTVKARPPVSSVTSVSSEGPLSSSGVRLRYSNGSKIPIQHVVAKLFSPHIVIADARGSE